MKISNSSDYLADYMAGRYKSQLFPYVSPYSIFHEHVTAEFTPLIELDSSNGLSLFLRDTVNTTGSGSVTESGGEFLVASGATSGSTAELRTKERGRYQPGIEGLAGQQVRYPVDPIEDEDIWWEYGDGIDGARIGHDGTGKYLQFIHAGTLEPKIYQQSWNMDTLDGSNLHNNPSGATLDPRFTTIWRVRFTHYGVGPAIVEVLIFNDDGGVILVPVHTFRNLGNEIFWENPKLPVRQSVNNGTTGRNLELFVGGRQFAVKGRYRPNRRQTPLFAPNKSIGTGSFIPVASFKKKADRKWRARSIKVSGLNILSTENIDIVIIIGGTLTGATWGNIEGVVPSETALESDTAATAVSGGTFIDGALGQGGQGNKQNLAGIRGLGVDIPDDTIVTLAARSRSGNSTVGAAFTSEEEA